MDAGAPLSSFAALLPCSPTRPPPPLPSASRSSPVPLACLPNLASFTQKIISSPPVVSPSRARRRHVLLVPSPPEEAQGKQQWLALCLCDLGCEWAAASQAYAPVAALALRPSAEEEEEEEEGDSIRHQGVLGELSRPQQRRDATKDLVVEQLLLSSLGMVPSSWFRPEPSGIDAAPQLCARRGKNEIRLLNTNPAGPEVRVLEQLRDTGLPKHNTGQYSIQSSEYKFFCSKQILWLDGERDSGIPSPSGFKSWCSHYSWIYFRISSDALSVGGDVPVDDEAPMVTS